LVFRTGTTIPSSSSSGSSSSTASSSSVAQGPYSSMASIPGTIQLENYDVGGEDVSYHDADDINSGNVYRTDAVDITGDATSGYKLGWTIAGEWVEYTISIPSEGLYKLEMKASMGGDSASFHIAIDGTDISEKIQVPSTGSWDTYTTITVAPQTSLSAGIHILRLTIDRSYGNYDWLSFTKVDPSFRINALGPFLQSTVSYDVFDLHGKKLGTVNVSKDSELQSKIKTELRRSGVFLIKEKSNLQIPSRSITVE
jgi:hypothetical protein